MVDRVPPRDGAAWEEDIAGRLLAAVDREMALGESYCPSCDCRLMREPHRREILAAVALTEETGIRCPKCGFAATVCYRELRAYHLDRSVTVDGQVVREEHNGSSITCPWTWGT